MTLASILGVLHLPTHLHLVVTYDRNKHRPPSPTLLAIIGTRTLTHIAIMTYPYILLSQTNPQPWRQEQKQHASCVASPLTISAVLAIRIPHRLTTAARPVKLMIGRLTKRLARISSLRRSLLASLRSFNKAITTSARTPGTGASSRSNVFGMMIWYYTKLIEFTVSTQSTSSNFPSISPPTSELETLCSV